VARLAESAFNVIGLHAPRQRRIYGRLASTNMKRTHASTFVLLGLLVLATSCKNDQAPGATGHEKPVKSVVNDPFGQPIAGATVAADGGASVTTDATGGFVLPYDGFKSKFFVVSRAGYTERKVTSVGNLKPLELIPTPPSEGVFLIGPTQYIPLEFGPLPVASPGFYKLDTATYTKLPSTSPMRLVIHGKRPAGLELEIKEVTQGDVVGFGPGMTLNPVEDVLTISGGGELVVHIHQLPPAAGKRWGLGWFAGRDSPPDGDRALLFTVE
jgi:hypothetical protein